MSGSSYEIVMHSIVRPAADPPLIVATRGCAGSAPAPFTSYLSCQLGAMRKPLVGFDVLFRKLHR